MADDEVEKKVSEHLERGGVGAELQDAGQPESEHQQDEREDPVHHEPKNVEPEGKDIEMAEPASEDRAEQVSDSDEDGESEDDSKPVETLVSGRQKRPTAGNRLSTLLDQEGGDDEVNLLFAEAEEEDVDFEDPDADDESAAGDEDDSSTDDEDQGPAAGEDDLEGERELDKTERAVKKAQKRKADKALIKGRPPIMRKKVKIDESTATTPSQEPLRPRKKSERVSWIPTAEEAPTRTSSRTLSVRNKERTIASMKESEGRRARQIAVMEAAQKRRDAQKGRPLTQEEKLAEAAKTERQNSKSLNKWEEMEKERAAKQQAKLEALQNRILEGPVLRWYSGPAEWVNGKLKEVGKKTRVEEIKTDVNDPTSTSSALADVSTPTIVVNDTDQSMGDNQDAPNVVTVESEQTTEVDERGVHPSISAGIEEPVKDLKVTQASNDTAESSATFLNGIHYYASLSEDENQHRLANSKSSATSEEHDSLRLPGDQARELDQEESPDPLALTDTEMTEPKIEHTENDATPAEVSNATDGITADAPATSEAATPHSEPHPNPDPNPEAAEDFISLLEIPDEPTVETPPPPTYEIAVRNLITLLNFDENAAKDLDVQRRVLFGTQAGPPRRFTGSGRGYPGTKAVTNQGPPPCAITGLPAKYRDPATGLPYANLEAYKAIRNVAKSGGTWSELLGGWVGGGGRDHGVTRPARGVPELFLEMDAEAEAQKAANGADATIKAEAAT